MAFFKFNCYPYSLNLFPDLWCDHIPTWLSRKRRLGPCSTKCQYSSSVVICQQFNSCHWIKTCWTRSCRKSTRFWTRARGRCHLNNRVLVRAIKIVMPYHARPQCSDFFKMFIYLLIYSFTYWFINTFIYFTWSFTHILI